MPDPKPKSPTTRKGGKPPPPAKVPPFEKDSPELARHKTETYQLKAAALGEIQAQIAALRELIREGVEPARSQHLLDLQLREIALREQIEAEAKAPPSPQPIAVTPEATFRDSTENACGPVGAAAAPGHDIYDYGEERTVTIKIRNTGRNGADCAFTVNLRRAPGGGGAAGAVKGTQKLNPGQSLTLRRTDVQVVEIVCDPAPAAGALCKASYTIHVAPAGA